MKKISTIDLDNLRLEVERLKLELDMSNKSYTSTAQELAKTQAYFRDNLPKLTGRAAMNMEKVCQMLGVLKIYQDKARQELSSIKQNGDPAVNVSAKMLEFFLVESTSIADKAMGLCNPDHLFETEPVVISTALYDYVFNEFKVDSAQRKLTIQGKTVQIPNSEFTYFIELLKKHNQDVSFDNSQLARTCMSRLKHRVPELKNYIQSVFGTGAYRMVVTPVIAK